MKNTFIRILRFTLFGVLTLAMCFSMGGCSPSPKDEEEIIYDLQNNSGFISSTAIIKNYSISKRQTDTGNKTDLIYMTVETEDEVATAQLSYILYYNLYNDGWVLDAIQQDPNGIWEITPNISKEELMDDYYINSPLINHPITSSTIDYLVEDCYVNSLSTISSGLSYSVSMAVSFDSLRHFYLDDPDEWTNVREKTVMTYTLVEGIWQLQDLEQLDVIHEW